MTLRLRIPKTRIAWKKSTVSVGIETQPVNGVEFSHIVQANKRGRLFRQPRPDPEYSLLECLLGGSLYRYIAVRSKAVTKEGRELGTAPRD